MSHPVNDNALDVIFRDARSYNAWQEKDIPETLIRAVYALTKMGPTRIFLSSSRTIPAQRPGSKISTCAPRPPCGTAPSRARIS